jgi:20S proteasome alpha/beta subunit
MTLVACLLGKDGLVFAADSRGTIGDPRGLTAINDKQQKLFRLTKFTGILTYGQAEMAAQLIAEIRSKATNDDAKIDEIMVMARSVIRERYQDWVRNIPFEHRQLIGFILGGLDDSGNAKAFYLSSPLDFAPQLVTTGVALGGIPQYATYLVHRLYNPAMNREHLLSLAVYIVAETATQDPKVGGPIRLAQIAKDTGFQEVEET